MSPSSTLRFVGSRFVHPLVLLGAVLLGTTSAVAGTVSGYYEDLPLSADTNLSQPGLLDWVKWGHSGQSGAGWTAVRKASVPAIISAALTPLGSIPGETVSLIAFPGGDVLDFDWTDGTSPVAGTSDIIITETTDAPGDGYPLGIGAAMTAAADAAPRMIDIYVQGFNADMLITAAMSGGGSDSVVITPDKHPATDPANYYASGRYRVTYSGAGETLTVSVLTQSPVQPGPQDEFANAGFFAAAIVPEPSSAILLAVGGLLAALIAARRRLYPGA